MTSTRFEIEKFTGKNDFGLWQVKMRCKGKKGNRGDDSGTSAVKCYHCKKKGHIQRNCPVLRNDEQQFTGSSNLAADDSDYDCAEAL